MGNAGKGCDFGISEIPFGNPQRKPYKPLDTIPSNTASSRSRAIMVREPEVIDAEIVELERVNQFHRSVIYGAVEVMRIVGESVEHTIDDIFDV